MNADLSTSYLGLNLQNPVVMSASPLTAEIHRLEQFAEAGVAAAVLPSLFAEHILERQLRVAGTAGQSDLHRSLHHAGSFAAGPDAYLRQLELAKQCLSIPIIASVNGVFSKEWVRFVRLIKDAGADALELNIYFVPTDASLSGEDVESRYVEIVSAIRNELAIPLAVKLGPYFSSLPHFARRLVDAGANGLVLFNRYVHPEIDSNSLEARPRLELSTSSELRLPLQWVGILRDQVSCSLAVTGGVHTVEDLVRSLLAGAHVVTLASALIQHGPAIVPLLLEGLADWIAVRRFRGVSEIRGIANFRRGPHEPEDVRADYAEQLAAFASCEQYRSLRT
jgi:dihydroorotate dehydrogenase (fumarate)